MRLPLRLLEQITGRELSADQVAKHLERVGFPVEEVIELLPFDPDIVTAQIAGKLKDDADGVILTAKTADENYYVYSRVDITPESVVLIAFAKSPIAEKALKEHKDVTAVVVVETDLGLEDDIPVILRQDTSLGVPMTDVLDSTVLDVEITPNRGDLYSVYGLARELSALFSERFESPEPASLDFAKVKHPYKLEIEAEADVTQYFGFVIGGVRVRPSPFWLRWGLHALGARPVNNVVDVTNYTMFLTGQPLHAFDASKIGGGTVKVRRAKPGEVFTAIDHKDYKLSADCLLIADKNRPVALAGVMGGLDSEVGDDAIGLFLESAEFTQQSARRSVTHTGIHSDSSKRFAAGIDGEMVRRAAVFFIHTLAELCPELSVKGELAYGQSVDKGSVNLEYSKLDTYANIEIDKDKAKKNLELIGFDVERVKDGFMLKVPSHRNDMAEDVDAIEEVLRLEGYDNLPSRFIVRTPEAGCRHPLSRKLGRIRNFFTGLGYNEIYSLSLISAPEVPAEFTGNAIPITNPLSERLSVLRPTLLPGMLSAMAENIRFGNRGLYFFEIGSVYRNTTDGFKEPLHLGILISGEVGPIGWDGDVRGSDYFDLKGAFEMFSEAFGHNDISFKDTTPSTYLDVEACRIIIDNKDAGYLGKVDAEVLKKADIPQEVYFCEVNMSLVLEDEKRKTYIKPLPRFKPVVRDMALLLDACHDAAEVMQFVKEHAGELCIEVEVFDSFTGSPLPKGKRNLGLRLRLQPSARNLSKEEVDERIAVLSGKIAAEFDALVRGREGNGS